MPGIYSGNGKCKCGSSYNHIFDKGLFCKNCNQQPMKYKVVWKGVTKRFSNYNDARDFLITLRAEFKKGSFDAREYHKDRPLSFKTLSKKWLNFKELQTKRNKSKKLTYGTYIKYCNYLFVANEYFGDIDVKEINESDLDSFVLSLDLSDKTIHNYMSCLHQFLKWCYKKEKAIPYIPEFPETSFTLEYRTTIDKDTQETILDEIYRITNHINPKIYLAIDFLRTYINVRPTELINIQEKHIDLVQGLIYIPNPKEKTPKFIMLLDDDVERLKEFPKAINGELYFFRHLNGVKGATAGERFGQRYLWKWWKKACTNVGIANVDLYGGTRHSSAISLGNDLSPEQIKAATGTKTNKAFERYFQIKPDMLRKYYALTKISKKTNAKANKV